MAVWCRMKVERGGFRGRLSAFLQKAMAGGREKHPGGNGQARCDRRLARAIRRASRAAAIRPPAAPRARPRNGARNRDTPVSPLAWKEARMTAIDPRPELAAMPAARLAPAAERGCRIHTSRSGDPATHASNRRPGPRSGAHIVIPDPIRDPDSRRRRSRWRAGSTAETAARTEVGPRIGVRGDESEMCACGRPSGGGGQRANRHMPEPAAEYAPYACRT